MLIVVDVMVMVVGGCWLVSALWIVVDCCCVLLLLLAVVCLCALCVLLVSRLVIAALCGGCCVWLCVRCWLLGVLLCNLWVVCVACECYDWCVVCGVWLVCVGVVSVWWLVIVCGRWVVA